MNKFKVDDRVRVLGKSCGEPCKCKGAITTVKRIETNFYLHDDEKHHDVVYVVKGTTTSGQNYFLEQDLELVEEEYTRRELMEVVGDEKYSLTIRVDGLDTSFKGYILNLNPGGSCYIDTDKGLVIVPSVNIVKCFPIKGGN